MPDCDYCDRSFPDEGSLLEHMGETHEDELGRIDQRRVDDHYGGDDTELSTTIGYAVIGIVFVAVIGGAVYVAVGAFNSEPQQLIHEHGTVNMTVDGESVDLHQYSDETEAFHFHPGDEQWHMEPREPGRLTLADAFSRIGIEVRQSRLDLGDRTFEEGESATEVVVRVNGESEDPSSYELQEDDHIRIAVETEN